jgi:hypothetical protein
MGRAGIEPATLGLKVRRERLRHAAANRNVLQRTRFTAVARCSELIVAETNSYLHSYSRVNKAVVVDDHLVVELWIAKRLNGSSRYAVS